MSTTLNFFDQLLALGQRYQALGRTREAIRILTRLVSYPDLPDAINETARVALGELELQRRKFVRARNHLAAVLLRHPESCDAHEMMGQALKADERGDLHEAAASYERALELEPERVSALVEAGKLAVRLGRTEEGLARLCRAVELQPNDVKVVSSLAKALRLSGRSAEARNVLRAAMFRNPKSLKFRLLWSEFQFKQARKKQQRQQRGTHVAHKEETAVLLPFVPRETIKIAGIRHDGPSSVGKPHRTRSQRNSEQRNVL